MEKQPRPFDVRASVMVRRIVAQSKKNGQLQRLKYVYEQMQLDQLALELTKKLHIVQKAIYQSGGGPGHSRQGGVGGAAASGSGSASASATGSGSGDGEVGDGLDSLQASDEEICALAKLRRLQDVKTRLRAAFGWI